MSSFSGAEGGANPPASSLSRRHLMWRYVVLGLLVLAGGGGAVWWWQRTGDPDYRLRQGQRALEKDDDETADRLLLLLEADGHKDHAHLLRGQKLVRDGQFARALAELNQIRDQGELRLEAAALSGRCLLELERPRQAVAAYQFVLKQRPDHLDAHRGLAQGYYNQGLLDQAIRHCQDWARLDPADGRPFRLEALIQGELARKEEAAECYRQALRRDLSDRVRDEVRLELAEVQVYLHQYRPALNVLDECSDEVAASVKARTLRAECLLGMGEKDKAVALLDRLIGGPNPQALRLRAGVHLEREEADAAAELLQRAVRLDPHQFTGRHLLGQAYQMLGKDDAAKEQLGLAKKTQASMDELTELTRKQAVGPLDAKQHLRMAELYRQLDLPQMADRSRRYAALLDDTPQPAKAP